MPPIVMLTAFGTIELAVKAMQLGAIDFITKPFTGDHITVVINKALEAIALRRQVGVLKKELDDRYGGMVGNNACGAHSVAWGTTAENTLALDVIRANGDQLRLVSPSLGHGAAPIAALRGRSGVRERG